ncbi:MAG: hypothetical protein SNJ71_05850, partial [Bacteroidales bacterium]
MIKYSVILVLLLWLNDLYSKNYSIIYGNNIEYRNRTITIYCFSDYLTKQEDSLTSFTIDSTGSFRCMIPINETKEIFMYLGIYKGFLYIEPTKTYELVFPPKKEKEMADILNPYFEPEEISIGIRNANENELNYMIAMFNQEYETFIAKRFYWLYISGNKKVVDSLSFRIDSLFSYTDNSFFITYKNYKMALLKHFTYQRDRNMVTREYLLNKPIQYNNPAYMDFFNEVWRNFFTLSYINEKYGERLQKDIQIAKSPFSLKNTLHANIALRNDTLKELVILRGLLDCLRSPEYPAKSQVYITLDSLALLTTIPQHKTIAQNIGKRKSKLEPGSIAPDFLLPDSDNNKVSLHSFCQKGFVYLMFCRSENYACLKRS